MKIQAPQSWSLHWWFKKPLLLVVNTWIFIIDWISINVFWTNHIFSGKHQYPANFWQDAPFWTIILKSIQLNFQRFLPSPLAAPSRSSPSGSQCFLRRGSWIVSRSHRCRSTSCNAKTGEFEVLKNVDLIFKNSESWGFDKETSRFNKDKGCKHEKWWQMLFTRQKWRSNNPNSKHDDLTNTNAAFTLNIGCFIQTIANKCGFYHKPSGESCGFSHKKEGQWPKNQLGEWPRIGKFSIEPSQHFTNKDMLLGWYSLMGSPYAIPQWKSSAKHIITVLDKAMVSLNSNDLLNLSAQDWPSLFPAR